MFPKTTKQQIRKKISAQLKKEIVNRQQRELQLKKRILNEPIVRQSKKIAFYSATQHEVSLNFLFEYFTDKSRDKTTDKIFYLPFFEKSKNNSEYQWQVVENLNGLQKGKYNILEPLQSRQLKQSKINLNQKVSVEEIELFFVPAIAFHSKYNWRIGRGGGYYDRLLSSAKGIKIGVGFKEQSYTKEHEIDSWDIKMDELWLV